MTLLRVDSERATAPGYQTHQSSSGRVALALVIAMLWVATGLEVRADVSNTATSLFKSALEHYHAGDLARAQEEYLKAYQADGAILSLNDEGMLDGVINYIHGRIQADPDDPAVNFQLAEFLNMGGRLESAVAYYERAVALDPGGPQAARAQAEADKLRQMVDAQAQGDSDSGDADTSGSSDSSGYNTDDGGYGYEDNPSVDPVEAEQAIAQVKALKDQLKALQAEKADEKKELATLKKEFETYKKQAEVWKTYHNLYFANPANLKLLGQGRAQ